MDKQTKKSVFTVTAINLCFTSAVLITTQFLGKKIVVEPEKINILTPKRDIAEGEVITKEMIGVREIYEKDYAGAIKDSDLSKIVKYKSKMDLKPNMQIYNSMLQNPKDQFKDGYVKVSIDLKDVRNTVANQVKINDYVNINLALEQANQNTPNNVSIDKAAQIVLAKRKVIELVNSNGVEFKKYNNDKGDFKTRFIILELSLNDYVKYKAAQMTANTADGNIELTICDPVQKSMKEDFKADEALKKQATKEATEEIESGNVAVSKR